MNGLALGRGLAGDAMLEFLSADTFTYAIAALFAGLAVVMVNAMTSSIGFAAAYAPGLFLGGLLGPYVSRKAALFLVADKDANTVLAVGAGILAALFVLLALTRLVYASTAIRHPITRAASTPR
jgi:hypothetical protein